MSWHLMISVSYNLNDPISFTLNILDHKIIILKQTNIAYCKIKI